jgi:hypothetical protein
VWHEQANKGERDDVEECDAPKDLFDGGREGLARVDRLGGGEADELGAREGEGGRDEDGTEALEAVVKGTRVVPVPTTDIAVVGIAAYVDNNTEEAARPSVSSGLNRKLASRGLRLAYMKPITAVILTRAKTNSDSP